jgi:predicted 2-oxoglutarate/Fe(II)-dependent dioxygenase YbiX
MATLFGFDTHELGVEDMFVAKYDMNGQRELMEHRDGSELSFVLVLNDEYLGGGTMFRNPKDNKSVLVRPDSVGDCVMFCGRHLHSGVQITSGVRYILTGFVRVYVDKDETKKKMLDEIVGTGKR